MNADELIRITGGAQIGWMNAGWPFARLTVSANELSVSLYFGGSYKFTADEIVKLEPYGWVPVLGRGIRIVHIRSDYPTKIVFWLLRDPERVLADIRRLGFLPRAATSALPIRSGMPFRWSAVILFIVVWNLLFVVDGFVPWKELKPPGPFAQVALALVFAVAFTTQRFEAVQPWVLQPGRTVGEVRPFLMLLQAVSGFLFVSSLFW